MSAWYWGPFSYKGSTGGVKIPSRVFVTYKIYTLFQHFLKEEPYFSRCVVMKRGNVIYLHYFISSTRTLSRTVDRVVVLWRKRHKGNLSKGGGRCLLYLICCGTCQVWSLTQFYSVDFSQSRIDVKKCTFNKRTFLHVYQGLCQLLLTVSWDLCA